MQLIERLKMTHIISIAQQKGGCGKTTIATNLATAITTHQKRVLLVDADPQASAMAWSNKNEDYKFPTIQVFSGQQIKMLVDEGNYDYVVIDCSPRFESEIASIIKISDLVVMPCQPSPLDIWACAGIVDMIKTRMHLSPYFKAYFLLNGTHPLSNIQSDILKGMEEYDLPLFKSVIAARTSYRRIMNEGKSVIHSNDEKASGEIEKLTCEIMAVLDE